MIFRNRKYELLLEQEIERLRQQNRELLNAILPKQGLRPLDAPAHVPEVEQRPRTLGGIRRKMTTEAVASAKLFRLELPKWMRRKDANGTETNPVPERTKVS